MVLFNVCNGSSINKKGKMKKSSPLFLSVTIATGLLIAAFISTFSSSAEIRQSIGSLFFGGLCFAARYAGLGFSRI